jgi:predicted metalloprotease
VRRASFAATAALALFGAFFALEWPAGARAQQATAESDDNLPSSTSVAQLESVANLAWKDAISTWKRLMPDEEGAIGDAHLNFVDKVTPRHCYGLYAGAGPVYCSGNNTVFVGITEMERLTGKFQPLGDVGLSVLIGHEIGHHIQRIHGRFRILSALVRTQPERQQEWIRRFELEADCLAGIWIRNSDTFGVMQQRRIEVVAALRLIGDDTLQQSGVISTSPPMRLHGTADERVAAFTRGLEKGQLEACDGFRGTIFE